MDAVIDGTMMAAAKALPDTSKIERFGGNFFKRWHDRIYDALDVMNLAEFLTERPPDSDSENYEVLLQNWIKANKVCRSTILNTLSMNYMIFIYSTNLHMAQLKNKYIIEDAGAQKYVIANFLDFRMMEDKEVTSQLHGFHMLINDLKNENIIVPESFCGWSPN